MNRFAILREVFFDTDQHRRERALKLCMKAHELIAKRRRREHDGNWPFPVLPNK